MRELKINEAQQVSGGIELAFFLSILSGANGCSFENTVAYSAMWGGFLGLIAGIPLMVVGAIITTPIGAACGALEGFIGYKIGELVFNGKK